MFTSGATEGIQTAVLSALVALRERRERGQGCGDLLLYGATEHKAVPESLAHWNRVLGTRFELRALPVDATGRHRLDILRELAPRAAFVCTMAANNETGVISDLDGIAAVLDAAAGDALWMVDCVQALGKLPLRLARTRIDYAPFSGHKLYAPKGIGMLYVREDAPFTPLMCGGGQEAGQRSGTENMAGIAALDAVLAALEEGGTFRSDPELAACRERLADALRAAFPGIVFNAPFDVALPTTLNFSVPGLASKDLLDLFDAAGLRVSAGSACSAAKAAPSYVLEAMGVPPERSAAAVRMSIGPLADDAFIDAACARIDRCGRALAAAVLVPSPLAGGQARGLVQLSEQGRIGWLLFDADSRECIAIDPPAPLAARVAQSVRAHGYRWRAVLGTGADAAGVAALRVQAGSDIPDWPEAASVVRLADGRNAPALRFGREVLVRATRDDGAGCAYLLGAAHDGELAAEAVRFAFAGDGPGCAALVGGATLVCVAHECADLPCTLGACVPAATRDPEEPLDLAPSAVESFWREHPDALLIDVREPAENLAGTPAPFGHGAHNVPLSRIVEHLAHWLCAEPRPLVFFCRSGNRSLKAASALRRLGHAQAWHLAGGLAASA
jgi:cysteine sulfinate desulfinase/cysteine desulfurase-like protein/rhodanese-related sulfurtransferase